MNRKHLVKILAFGLAAAFLVWLTFGGYVLAVSGERANINQTNFQAEFTNLCKQEQDVFLKTGFYFWPSWPVEKEVLTVIVTATATPAKATTTPWPTFTPGPFNIQDSYGDYYDCDTDPVTNECKCQIYHYTIKMTRDNCGNHLCQTKIEFTSEYGDGTTMWIDYYDVKTSKPVHNGDVVELPSLDSVSWDIGPRSFFELTPTP